MEWNAQLGILLEVSLAMLLGGLIGLEREFAQRPAGFRTHMLIAGAAALLVGLGEALLRQFLPLAADVRSDPIRVVEAVVAAVGFIAAGSILRTRRGDDV
nr:MgtC/SapB family protein [Deinococcus peraridilitoris]